MKRSFAFYDFDDTLLPGDSIGYLLKYYYKKHPFKVYRLLKVAYYALLWKLKMKSFVPCKEAMLYVLDDLSEQQLKEFYIKECQSRYYEHVVETLKKHKEEGCLIYLVSASPEAYLRYTDLPIDELIGTQTLGKSHHMTSPNCKGKEKVRRIQEVLKEKNLEIDYDSSYGYSDSITDLPMLSLVKNRIRIHKKDGSMSPFE